MGEATDNSIKGLVNGVFVTHLDWRNIGGLVGLIYKAKSSHRESFFLCGPPGLVCELVYCSFNFFLKSVYLVSMFIVIKGQVHVCIRKISYD